MLEPHPTPVKSRMGPGIVEINPEYLLEGLMLKLKLQCFGHLMHRGNSLEKTLMLGRIEGGRRREQRRMRWLDGITDTMDGEGQGTLVCCSQWGCKESDTTEQLNNDKWVLKCSQRGDPVLWPLCSRWAGPGPLQALPHTRRDGFAE